MKREKLEGIWKNRMGGKCSLEKEERQQRHHPDWMYPWFAETLQTKRRTGRLLQGEIFSKKKFKSRIKCSKNIQNSEYQWWVRLLNIELSRAPQTKVSITVFEKCGLGKYIEVASVSLWNLEMRTCKAETMKPKCICLCTWKMAAWCNEKAPN